MAIETGDLIFACIGGMQDAISAVTRGYEGARLNHVGVAIWTDRGLFVLEAIDPEVQLIKMELYARRTKYPLGVGVERYIVARLMTEHQHLVPKAIAYGISQRDKPYDYIYHTDKVALYCSELVVDMFSHANGGAFFVERPMSFVDIETGEVHPTFRQYFEYFGVDLPAGVPGSNPGDMSCDPRLEIIEINGPIPGLNQ